MKLFPPPLHLCLYIILKCQSAFPLALWLSFCSTLSHTHMHAQQRAQEIHCMLVLSVSHSTPIAHIVGYRHTRDGHTCTQTKQESERNRDPKHQNSINPLRRSLKGFLKADFQHTEAFQVSTVCGGNGAEAFKLYARTFPLCYLLFLPLSHTIFPPLSHSFFYSLHLSLHLFFDFF